MKNYFASKGTLKEVVEPLYGKLLENIPSIRFPGPLNFFRAVDVDQDVAIITSVSQQRMILGSKLKFQKKLKQDDDKGQIIEGQKLLSGEFEFKQKQLLLYPAHIIVPIVVPDGKIGSIVSMINGRAFHIIDNMQAPKCSLQQIVISLAGQLSMAPKAYFIKNLQCLATGEFEQKVKAETKVLDIENLIFFISPAKKMDTFAVSTVFTVKGEKKYIQSEYSCEKKLNKETGALEINLQNTSQTSISNKGYLNKINTLFSATKPSNEALYEATAGQENIKDLEKIIQDAVGKSEEKKTE